MALAVAARLPWLSNPLGLTVPAESKQVVYLDYEATRDDFQRRIKKICQGNDLGFCNIIYRRCHEPLADEIDDLAEKVGMADADLVVVDSIGAACAGDLNGSDTPTRFFNAIRKFGCTVLCTYHQNKDKEMYGNRFFWNYARSVWEVKKTQSPGDPYITLGLYHQKFNEGALFKPHA